SKIFDNEDFGFHKITVERPLRLNFQLKEERIARLDEQASFRNLATSKRKNETLRQKEIAAGKERQDKIRRFLRNLAVEHSGIYMDRAIFLSDLKQADRDQGIKLNAPERKAIIEAIGERDETAEICRDAKGNPEPDPELRDSEIVALKESIDDYFR